MRLDDLDKSGNIEDRRGESGGGGGGFGLPIGGGGLGIGAIVVLGLIGWALGIDPRVLIGGAEILSGGNNSQIQQPAQPGRQARQTGAPSDDTGGFVARVLGSTETQWKAIFQEGGKTYRPPILVMYNGRTPAACGGMAQSAMGPFYCPTDQKVYLDTSFFREIENRFHGCAGKACQFSQAYVIAHEVGHHVQNLLGVLPKVQQQQQKVDKAEANRLQVRVELQADCLAGVWANRENQQLSKGGQAALYRARRRRGGDADGLRDRRRHLAAPGDRPGDAGLLHPRLFSTAPALVHDRLEGGQHRACNTFRTDNI